MHVEFAELHKLNYKLVEFDKLNSKLDELDKLHKLNSKFDEWISYTLSSMSLISCMLS